MKTRILAALLCLSGATSLNAQDPATPGVDPGMADRLPAPFQFETRGQPDPARFGLRPSDEAFSAFQRGFYLTAHNLAKPLAENGDPAAQTLLAELLAKGLGVPANPAEAAKWYKAAAEQGVAEAEFQYGLLLIDGRIFPADPAKALELMLRSAKSGNRLAQFNAGQLILQSNPGFEGRKEALPWFRMAAAQDLPDAQYALSQLLLADPLADDAQKAEAVDWLTRSARKNFDTAQLDLATALIEGRLVPQDYEAGFRWMQLAARQGNVAAQNRLAKLYRAGLGTEGDSLAAAAWYLKARRAGLTDPEMEIFLDGLTEEERREALARANRLL